MECEKIQELAHHVWMFWQKMAFEGSPNKAASDSDPAIWECTGAGAVSADPALPSETRGCIQREKAGEQAYSYRLGRDLPVLEAELHRLVSEIVCQECTQGCASPCFGGTQEHWDARVERSRVATAERVARREEK